MDEIDDLLNPKPPPAEPAGLRDAAFRVAGRIQRRRRWLIRGRRVAVLAVCYTAGLVSMWWYWSSTREPLPALTIVERPQEPSAPPAVVDPYRNDPPERLEKWAFLQTAEKRVELYRRAGDGYLARDDVEAALRCYRRALDGGSAADLAIRADSDSWLLMSLKMARTKERHDGRVN
jgi:hypothetical protein